LKRYGREVARLLNQEREYPDILRYLEISAVHVEEGL